jgi:hypothetical protein
MEDDKCLDASTHPSHWQVPRWLAVSDSEKAESLADSLEARFQPVDNPSYPEFTYMVNEAMRAYQNAPQVN